MFITLLTLVSCAQPVVDVFGGISGSVLDQSTGAAVGGARVTITPSGLSQITAADGEFFFEKLEAQDYTLSVQKDGYEDMSRKVSVRAGVSSSVQVALKAVQPVMHVDPVVLDFGEESTSLALDITNAGKGALEWVIEEDIEWLTCSSVSGTTTDKVSSVVVKVSRDGMEKGSYSETIVISSNGGSEVVKVKMSVGSDIIISVNPVELDFGTRDSEKEIVITNGGSAAVEYTASSANDWLTLSKKSATVAKTDRIRAIVSREGLAAGSYSSSITISTAGGDLIVPVNMEVEERSAPSVTLEEVADITSSSAVGKGTLVSIGSSKVFRYGFCVSKDNEQPTVDDVVFSLGDCAEPKSFSATMTGLESQTAYHVRAFAENQEGVAYSTAKRFATNALPKLPEVATGEVSEITSNTAVAGGTVSDLGNVKKLLAHGHVWNTTGDPTLSNGESTDLGELAALASFSSTLENLESDTRYYVKAYATNEKGTVYGDVVQFTTGKGPVVLSDVTVTDVTRSSASLSAQVVSDGGHTIAERGFAYVEYGSVDYKYVPCDNDFTLTLTGLKSAMEYKVAAYVRNPEGDTYYSGYFQYFTTLAAPTDPVNGLYAYYTFENNTDNTVAGASDASGISTSYVSGVREGKALKFTSADSRLNIPEPLIDGGTFTVSFWVKDFNDGHIFSVASDQTAAHCNAFLLGIRGGKLTYVQSGWYFWYHWDNQEYSPSFEHPALTSSDWNLITITSELKALKSTVKLYIDGKYMDFITLSGQTNNTIECGTKLVFGGALANSSFTNSLNWLAMSIDNLRVYNSRALTAEEVKQIYEYERDDNK